MEEMLLMKNEKTKEDVPKTSKAKTVGDWAKATENMAKALGATVGLALMILWEIWRHRPK